jgi:serine/threonine protein kinase
VGDGINTLSGGQSPNASTGVLIGQLLGERYRIVGEIGKGGMATVYVAEHMLIGRLVAIKVLHPQFAENAECVRRFLAEGRTVGTLGHPNIVESTDMGFTANGAPFMVLELLDGRNLEEEIHRCGKLPIARAVHIAQQIASALAAAHARGVIHRDLKTPNIFLIDPGGRDHVKVLDFGISKFLETTGKTQRGMLLGTPSFMSPEQVSDPGSVDRRTDVYSLGVILYEMVGGKLPFDQTKFPPSSPRS